MLRLKGSWATKAVHDGGAKPSSESEKWFFKCKVQSQLLQSFRFRIQAES